VSVVVAAFCIVSTLFVLPIVVVLDIRDQLRG
jgi:hypothetical protein